MAAPLGEEGGAGRAEEGARDQLSPSDPYRGSPGAGWSDPKRYLPACALLPCSGHCLCRPPLPSPPRSRPRRDRLKAAPSESEGGA